MADHETRDGAVEERRVAGAGLLYLVAVVGTGVSADTSWRFFRDVLHIDHLWERVLMFAVLELFLIACGWGTRANVRRGDPPGAPQTVAWMLCGLSAYMAVMVSGPLAGVARVALGPVVALVALHLALGIDIRAHAGEMTGTLARVGREIRERVLSRLGLGDDQRDAVARTRDRARDRAARLATAGWTPMRRTRLARAVRVSGATLDVTQRDRLVQEVAALQNVKDLTTADFPSPWKIPVDNRSALASGGDQVGDQVGEDQDQVASGQGDQVGQVGDQAAPINGHTIDLGALMPPAYAAVDSLLWTASVLELRAALEAENRPGDGDLVGRGVSEVAGDLAPRVPRLDPEQVRAYVSDWMLASSGQVADSGYPWADMLPYDDLDDGLGGDRELEPPATPMTDEDLLAHYGPTLREVRDQGKLSRYRVEQMTGAQKRQAQRVVDRLAEETEEARR